MTNVTVTNVIEVVVTLAILCAAYLSGNPLRCLLVWQSTTLPTCNEAISLIRVEKEIPMRKKSKLLKVVIESLLVLALCDAVKLLGPGMRTIEYADRCRNNRTSGRTE